MRRVVASIREPSFSTPTVLTIVASTSAVAATAAIVSMLLASPVRTAASASRLVAKPSRPIVPIAAAVPLTSWRRVEAGSSRFWRSIVSKRWVLTSDMGCPSWWGSPCYYAAWPSVNVSSAPMRSVPTTAP
ncbi:hypothetical protein GKE82_20295 [Conexibacter sp. W3-3-2]|uniref:hypothetical protein n=1 Tax=Conexibacter sp. W3-3-2 TaxID=2675227 RepID=UPI0012B8B280|nr:hypothetical protein [Conexibacter sp. W3-3-2]MTD46564.1 hypothetical protein [Conexibacter sp. W3-3-2]